MALQGSHAIYLQDLFVNGITIPFALIKKVPGEARRVRICAPVVDG